MKCSELKELLARAVAFQGDRQDNRRVSLAFPILEVFANKTVSQLAKDLNALPCDETSHDTEIEHLTSYLQALNALLDGQAKPAVINEMNALSAALNRHAQLSFAALLAKLSSPAKAKGKKKSDLPVRQDVVLRYCRRLEEALGDDTGFNSVFAGLEADNDLTSAEIAAIAKAFANSRATARPTALKNIFSRHQAIMVGRAKSAATAGRIAG